MLTQTNPDDILLIDDHQIARQIELIFIEEKSANKSPNYPEGEQLNTLKDSLVNLIIYLNGIITHDQLDFDNLINDELLEALPDFQPRIYDLNKKILNAYPPLIRLIVLLHYLEFLQTNERNKLKKKWVLIGLLIAIRLKVQGLNGYYKTLILRIKLAVFSKSPTYAWIWQALESETLEKVTAENKEQNGLSFIQILTQHLHGLADKHFEQMEIVGNAKGGEKQAKQLDTIAKTIEQSFYKSHRQRAKIEADDKQREKRREEKIQQDKELRKKNKIPSQSAQVLAKPIFHQPVESNYTWDKPKHIKDIEAFALPLQHQYILPSYGSETQPTSFEEKIDNVERLINYTRPPRLSVKYSVPLQTVELSLQQVYISRRDFRLNSDTRLLSQYAYQQLFARLVVDATSSDENILDWHKKSASLLLLSFITAMPIKTLIQPHFIATCSLFLIQKTQAFIQYELGITKRSNRPTHLMFENDSDKITLPLPIKLIHYLSKSTNLPKIETGKNSNNTNELSDYLSLLREELELPYLSINRIETALETILTRYTVGSHSHIAELICRTPAPDAPATFYSSHLNNEIITHYAQALDWLNINGKFPLDYFSRRQNEKVGSGATLTLETVHDLLSKLKTWISDSDNLQVLFNRFSAYMWLVLCLLTGIRPNNGLGKVQDIDLDMGWLIINDKPNRSVKNHRLVPLCHTLIIHLTAYQQILGKLRLNQLHRPAISQTLFDIKTESNDVPLLNLLSDNFEKMLVIKRGDILQLIQSFISLDPYWTRHFVRTQLEKRNVPIHLVNAVIGHEKNQQEVLGKFSSTSKRQLHDVSSTFEEMAKDLGLQDNQTFLQSVSKQFTGHLNT